MTATPMDPTAAYLGALASGDADAILARFSGEPLIEDPSQGSLAATPG